MHRGALNFSRKLPALRQLIRPIYVSKGIIPEVASGLQAAADQTGAAGEQARPDSDRALGDRKKSMPDDR